MTIMPGVLSRRAAAALAAGLVLVLVLPVACDRPAQPRRGYWNTVTR